jgi:hypothetical protein
VTESYTHSFAKDERAAAEKLGELLVQVGRRKKKESRLLSQIFPRCKNDLPGPASKPLRMYKFGCAGPIRPE